MALVFSSYFPVAQKRPLEVLAEPLKSWVADSPHRSISRAELGAIMTDGFSIKKGHVELETARHEETENQQYGLRLIERRPDAVRTTDVIGKKTEKDFTITVMHEYEATRTGERVQPNKVRIVNDLLNVLGGGPDGSVLHVQSKPYWLCKEELPFVEDVILNKTDNQLPVVYVSRNAANGLAISPERLAYKLSGMAHVLVEPDRIFSLDLGKKTGGANAYLGAVALHWPNGIKHFLIPERFPNLEENIFQQIRERATLTLVPVDATYDGIKRAQTHHRFEQMKNSQKASIDDALKLAVDEIDSRDKTINELRERIARLEMPACKTANYKDELIKMPLLAEMYTGEFRDFLIDALKNSVQSTPDNSRRRDFITAVLNLNKPSETRDELLEKLHRYMHGEPRNFTNAVENMFKSFGFAVKRGSKHFLLYVPGHEHRTHSMSCTPSDHRSWKNAESEIRKYLL